MKTSIKTFFLGVVILTLASGSAQALTVCSSSAPIPQTNSISLYYDTLFPQQVGAQANTRLEFNHNGSASLVGGLLKKDGATGATPSCTSLNQMHQDPNSGQWYCPGYLRVQAKVDKPGLSSLTLIFVESVNVTQQDFANVFNTWPHCTLGGIVPCQPGDANATSWLPFVDSVFPHSKQLHPINIKSYTQSVTLTDTSVAGYIQTNINAPNHQEYLQINVYQNSYPSSWANQNPSFFVFGQQFAGGGGGACVAVAPLLPVQHNP